MKLVNDVIHPFGHAIISESKYILVCKLQTIFLPNCNVQSSTPQLVCWLKFQVKSYTPESNYRKSHTTTFVTQGRWEDNLIGPQGSLNCHLTMGFKIFYTFKRRQRTNLVKVCLLIPS